MSRDASVSLAWADGDYTFKLAWGELILLQEACDAGPFVIFDRLASRQCRVQDISHTIRLGLIGGGITPDKALKLVRDYVESRPPAENLMLARGILGVAIMGAPEDQPKKGQGRRRGKSSTTSPTENSGSA